MTLRGNNNDKELFLLLTLTHPYSAWNEIWTSLPRPLPHPPPVQSPFSCPLFTSDLKKKKKDGGRGHRAERLGPGSQLGYQATYVPWLPAWQPCQGDGSGDPSSPGEASRTKGNQRGKCSGTRWVLVCQLKSQTEPWGDWHVELPSSFQIQFPGQHCGLLCVSLRSRASGPRCQGVEAEVEAQSDN